MLTRARNKRGYNMSINQVILLGNVGKDPEIRKTSAGKPWATFSLATTDRVRGEDHTEWHNIVVWSPFIVELIDKFVKKGSKIHVTGQLKTRKYEDNNGVTRYATEVVVSEYRGVLTLEGSKPDTPRDGDRVPPGGAAPYSPRRDLDDDIPF